MAECAPNVVLEELYNAAVDRDGRGDQQAAQALWVATAAQAGQLVQCAPGGKWDLVLSMATKRAQELTQPGKPAPLMISKQGQPGHPLFDTDPVEASKLAAECSPSVVFEVLRDMAAAREQAGDTKVARALWLAAATQAQQLVVCDPAGPWQAALQEALAKARAAPAPALVAPPTPPVSLPEAPTPPEPEPVPVPVLEPVPEAPVGEYLKGKAPEAKQRGEPPAPPDAKERQCPTNFVITRYSKMGSDDLRKLREDKGFQSITGMDSEKRVLQDAVVGPVLFPDMYEQRAAKASNVILYGPGGTGKSMLARGTAIQAGMDFIEVSAADIKGKFVGQTEKCMDLLFKTVTANPVRVLVMFDEMDQLLATKEGEKGSAEAIFKNITGQTPLPPNFPVIIGTTNNPSGFSQALNRRFPVRKYVALPGRAPRLVFMKDQLSKGTDCLGNKITLHREDGTEATDADWKPVLDATDMWSPADLKALVSLAVTSGRESMSNVANLYFCPNPDGATWQPRDAPGAGCKRIDDLSPEQRLRICWPYVTPETFLRLIRENRVRRSTTAASMGPYLEYAQSADTQSVKGIKRQQATLLSLEQREQQ